MLLTYVRRAGFPILPAFALVRAGRDAGGTFTAAAYPARNKPPDLQSAATHLASIPPAAHANPAPLTFPPQDKIQAYIACEYSPQSSRMHPVHSRPDAKNKVRRPRAAPTPREKECKPGCPGCAPVR